MSDADVLQVYSAPEVDLPIEPAGAQKAPGVTVGIIVGIGNTETVGDTDGVGTDDVDGLGVGDGDGL